MPTQVVCPSCANRLRIPEHLHGQMVKCRGCDRVFKAVVADDHSSDAHSQRASLHGEPRPVNGEGQPGFGYQTLTATSSDEFATSLATVGCNDRIVLRGLQPAEFQHPLDQKATANLQAMKGFNWLVAKFLEYGVERAAAVEYTGSAIRVTPEQYPKLHLIFADCCEVLDLPQPPLYVLQSPIVNAFTSGHNNPFVVVHTALLDLMEDDEIMAVLAHELGHIKCGHVLYMQMARFIKPLMEVIGDLTLQIGKWVGVGIEAALLLWSRRAELSADRAALLALQQSRPCVGMLMKLAGGSRRWSDQIDSDQFLKQAREYKEETDQKTLERVYQFLNSAFSDHPDCVERARALDEFANSSQYRDILHPNGIGRLME